MTGRGLGPCPSARCTGRVLGPFPSTVTATMLTRRRPAARGLSELGGHTPGDKRLSSPGAEAGTPRCVCWVSTPRL